MPFWPFSISSPKNKEGELPWHAAIIPFLQVKEVFTTVVTIPDTEMKKYEDPPETNYMTQFTRLKLFLDAELLDKNGRAWKELQEADPDFRKIRMIHELSDHCRKDLHYTKHEAVTTFPEEWKDEHFFLCWLYVNVQALLLTLDADTLERAVHVIMNTNYIEKWYSCGTRHRIQLEWEQKKAEIDAEIEKVKEETNLEKQRRDLERNQRKIEKKLAKEKKKQEKLEKQQNHG